LESPRGFILAMRHRVQKKLILYRLITVVFLFGAIRPVEAIVLHPNHEPDLAVWTDRPDSNVVGQWSDNASFVVIAPNWIATTRHQSTLPSTVTIEGASYTCHYKAEWLGGPSGNADIRLVRLTASEGANPNLAHYAEPYTQTDEYTDPNGSGDGRDMRIGGYGRGRESTLKNGPTVYGYTWGTGENNHNNTFRWCTNRIEDDGSDPDILNDPNTLIGYFDVPGWTIYEGSTAEYDSGGGWFIKDGNDWKLAGLTAGSTYHPEYEPNWPDDGGSWFRYIATVRGGDLIYSVRISSYAEWISGIIQVSGDLTGDDWVDADDFAKLADQWLCNDCNDLNNFCDGADFEPIDGKVDWADLGSLATNWLSGWQY